ncbi:Beta-barrel assembly-enhancing protease [Sporomusa silvacetica DSM 10669]|uniref:Beta-barrel assembly-enhancing protease n=1 Tax=Sporomusa silvacetica DSM 10669 TaxID=1123289 RepID=A0ABZ3IT71_9FIRM|nr:TPR repeat-containing protein YrrB [Sporomusa silvacetica DSM 10669]
MDEQIEEVLADCRNILKHNPYHAQAHVTIGNIMRLKNDFVAALVAYHTAIDLDASLLEAYINLAGILIYQKKYKQAIDTIQKALFYHTESPELYLNLGLAFKLDGDWVMATEMYEKAITLRPYWAEAYYNLAGVLKRQNRIEEAIVAYQTTLAIKPDWAEAYNDFGILLQYNNQLEKAYQMYSKAVALKPLWPISTYNLAKLAIKQGWIEQAIEWLRKTIAIEPDFSPAHVDLALLLLQQGNYIEGWKEYEWRLNDHNYAIYRKMSGMPLWDGTALNGRTLLLWSEQGLGDTLQFVRYISLIQKEGGTIILQVPQLLVLLLKNLVGVDQVIPNSEPINGFDVHCSLFSLPRIFGTTLENIPSVVPYLQSPSSFSPELYMTIVDESSFKIGIVWKSGNKYINHQWRDCDLSYFQRLTKIKNVKLFSMQVGEDQKELLNSPGQKISNLACYIDHFASTAAIVEHMDLIITVDTAMAHLAGGLGKKVWLLLNASADWRWMLWGNYSPWYPTMRLFRQSQPGDWTSVFDQITQLLNETSTLGNEAQISNLSKCQ